MQELRYDGRVAVITGAGRGLGREYALLLAARGAKVLVNDLGGGADGSGGGGSAAQDVVDEITAAGGTAVANGDDVSTPESGRRIISAALDSFGQIDILINNAGILRDQSLPKMTSENFDAVIDVHLRGAFCVTQPAFVHMRERGYGRMVFTTSAAGLWGNFGQVNYSAAKLGLVGMARTVAHEGEKYGVLSNVVSPVAYSRLTAGLLPDALRDTMGPEHVAPIVGYLAHESCSFTGEILSAAGGRVGRVFLAEAPGYRNPRMSVEDVAAHIETIMSPEGFVVPKRPQDAVFPA